MMATPNIVGTLIRDGKFLVARRKYDNVTWEKVSESEYNKAVCEIHAGRKQGREQYAG